MRALNLRSWSERNRRSFSGSRLFDSVHPRAKSCREDLQLAVKRLPKMDIRAAEISGHSQRINPDRPASAPRPVARAKIKTRCCRSVTALRRVYGLDSVKAAGEDRILPGALKGHGAEPQKGGNVGVVIGALRRGP